MKTVYLLSPILLLAACTQPLPSETLVPASSAYDRIPSNAHLERAVRLGTVSVYENAGGMVADVEEKDYRETLQSALLTAGFATRGNQESYRLDAYLQNIDYPTFGGSMKVTTKARYVLVDRITGKSVFDDTLVTTNKATYDDAYLGNNRARKAMSYSISSNIALALERIAKRVINPGVTATTPTSRP